MIIERLAGAGMKIRASALSFMLILLCAFPAISQTGMVNGVVRNAEQQPVPGAVVSLKSQSRQVLTDASGRFAIQVTEPSELTISSVSYQDLSMRVTPESRDLEIELVSKTAALNEVVVVGYGTQRRGSVTGALASISSDKLRDIPVATVGQMLQGRLAGVRVTQTSGRPGQGINVQVRGSVSLTAGSAPLYVVDGFPISGDLNYINPDEIENITVLKDPAAASLYGSRSANGVVLVTTKGGKSGKLQMEFNSYYGLERVPEGRRLKMMNAQEYAQFQKEIATFNGRPVNPAFQNPESYGAGTDWFREVTRTGAIQSYNLSLSSGTEKFQSAATIGYFNQEGVIVGTGFERFSLRMNMRYQPFKKLKIGLNIAPTYVHNTNFNTDGWPYVTENVVSSALLTTPLASPYNSDGTLALTARDPATFGNPNWLRVAKEKVFHDKDFRVLANAYVDYEIVKGLVAKSTFNAQIGNQNIFQFNPSTIGILFIPPPRVPFGSNNDIRSRNLVNENTLTYQTKIGDKHNFDALAGFTVQHFRSDGTLVNASNYPSDRIQAVSAARQTLVTANIQEWALVSLLGRIGYNYDNKYFLQASFRRDGSSRFGPNNRWGNFPAISAGWVVSNEGFWNLKAVNYFKLRASYGITGNFEIGNYSHFTTLGNVFYPFDNAVNSGLAPNNLGDQNLGWENNKQFNLGADVNMFGDRIRLSYNFYTRRTTNLLFNVNVPLSSGFSNIQSNIGELKFWGHEFNIDATVVKKNDFSWNSNFNISFDRNRTEKLATQGGILPSGIQLYQFRSHMTRVGQPIAQFFGAIWDGVYMNQADFDKSPKNEASKVGTIKFRDLNGDGKITFPEDMTLIGNPWPKFTFGMSNYLNYRNFDLSFIIAGSYGNDILAFYENWTTNLDGVFNVLAEVKNRWKSEAEPGDGKYGSVAQGTTFLERDRWNSRFIKDGSYLALKNFTLGYQFIENKKFNTRAYLSVQNAFILTRYEGGNPEVNTQANGTTGSPAVGITPGVDENSYPIPRTITLGLSFRLK